MPETSGDAAPLIPHTRRKTRIGLVSGGLGTYWDQFPALLPKLKESAAYVGERFKALDAELIDAGFVSDATEAHAAANTLRVADCDMVVVFAATYLTASMVLPIAQRAGVPVLVIDLQPTASMDHPNVTTGDWLAYCGQCPVPEIAHVFRRAGIDFRSVSGHLRQEAAWERINRWVAAAGIRGRLRTARHGMMGHLYPGMLDVSTDPLNISARFGSHVEILEFDDLRVRVDAVTDIEVEARIRLAKNVFTLDPSLSEADLSWAARVSVGLDALVSDFDLDSLAYYHRGLAGEIHERLGAGMILGSSLLTARGIPLAGEYELRTSLAMLTATTLGAGGSFTELQALDFTTNVVEMGHDGPAHLRMSSGRPLLRGLGVYHGKRGSGVSVEFDVRHGPVTCLGLGEDRDGSYSFITSQGTVVDGPLLAIGNTTSRVAFGTDPGLWVDAWSATGVGHHWALCTGHRAADIAAAASLLGIEHRQVESGS